jgi:hypothetical protein
MERKLIFMPRVFSSLLFALALSACGDAAMNFPVTKAGQAQLDDVTIIRLDQTYSGGADTLHSGHAVADAYFDRCLTLPLFMDMSEAEVDYVVAALTEILS